MAEWNYIRRASVRKSPRRQLDYWSTPAWATAALFNHCLGNKVKSKFVWEPAAGGGEMLNVLTRCFSRVVGSDIEPRMDGIVRYDFLSSLFEWDKESESGRLLDRWHRAERADRMIITNPPFNLAQEFVARALALTPNVAILARLSFLEGVKRFNTLFKDYPPETVHVFTERIAFRRSGLPRPNDSGMAANAWLVWETGENRGGWNGPMRTGRPMLNWIPPCKHETE